MCLSRVSDDSLIVVLLIAAVLSILSALGFLIIKYPISVEKEKVSIRLIPQFIKNKLFMTIAFYLFFQSAFEAMVNNWSVSYFIDALGTEQNKALVALSYSVLGLIAMRLLIGSVFKKMNHHKIIALSLALLAMGTLGLIVRISVINSLGMILLGAGLASGFPVMLGLVGEMFKEISGTAFSFAMLIALTGNTIVNYLIGVLTNTYGMRVYMYVVAAVVLFMVSIYLVIRRLTLSDSK